MTVRISGEWFTCWANASATVCPLLFPRVFIVSTNTSAGTSSGRRALRRRVATWVAAVWLWSVVTTKETRPLVSAMIGELAVFSIEVVINAGREIRRARATDGSQPKQRSSRCLTRLLACGVQAFLD